MILKQLDLRNIRSYETLESLTFDEGVSLLFGDVAAGKSSILYAIEFALFGLTGDLTGSKLLRRGSDEGSVALTFEQDGQQYTVTRLLSQAGSGIRQADCALTANGDTKAYSVTDLKSEIVRILRFRERPSAKASSVIYRYGVFTPQEEMKEILRDKPDDRLQTLRRAFRLDQYARAADNADDLRRYLKNTGVAVLREQARGLDDDQEALESKKATLEETCGQKDGILNQIAQVGEAIGKLKAKQHQLEVKLEEVPSESELEALKNALELAGTKQADLEQELLELDATEEALEEERGELAGHLRPTDKSDEGLSIEVERLEGERDDLIEKRAWFASETNAP